jgi:hypothetical protein
MDAVEDTGATSVLMQQCGDALEIAVAAVAGLLLATGHAIRTGALGPRELHTFSVSTRSRAHRIHRRLLGAADTVATSCALMTRRPEHA